MKNYKVIFDVDGKQVVAHYDTLAQAQTVANSATKVLGYVTRIIAKKVRKAIKIVRGVLSQQELVDLDLALDVITEVKCNNCNNKGYTLANYVWAKNFRNFIANKLNIRY